MPETIVLDLGRAPAKPLSINEANSMRHWAQRSRRLKPWNELAWAESINQKIPERVAGRKAVVKMTIPVRTNHTRDPSNYIDTVVKATVDGMVRAKVWPDDNPEYVEVVEPEFAVKGGGKVEIFVDD